MKKTRRTLIISAISLILITVPFCSIVCAADEEPTEDNRLIIEKVYDDIQNRADRIQGQIDKAHENIDSAKNEYHQVKDQVNGDIESAKNEYHDVKDKANQVHKDLDAAKNEYHEMKDYIKDVNQQLIGIRTRYLESLAQSEKNINIETNPTLSNQTQEVQIGYSDKREVPCKNTLTPVSDDGYRGGIKTGDSEHPFVTVSVMIISILALISVINRKKEFHE